MSLRHATDTQRAVRSLPSPLVHPLGVWDR